jgi:hypothetical protein
MNAKLRFLLPIGLLILALTSLFIGRHVEEEALAKKRAIADLQPKFPARTVTPPEPTFRELAVTEILALPFGKFYEALRSAPGEAREKWAAELEKMPAGSRRTAALAAFYKLLVQFDPIAAGRTACAIKDKKVQELALDSVTGAAPGFALRDIAELFLKLPPDPSNYRKCLENVVSEWVVIDPPAVAKFFDEHRDETENVDYRELIKNWAALDPEAAKKWIDARGFGPGIVPDFFDGWYLNDPRAAVAYAIAHAEDLKITTVLENALSALYVDSKEDAKKFIEELPNDELRNKAFRAFEFAVQFGTADETGEPDRTPRAVADWMTQFPPAYWREHLSQVLSYWNASPPQEVLSWIEQQPAEIQDAVADEYQLRSAEDAVKAVTAVSQFIRPDLRDRLLAAMFHNSSSSAWQMVEEIKKSSLPVEQKQHVLEIAAQVEKDEEAAREERARAENDQGSEK